MNELDHPHARAATVLQAALRPVILMGPEARPALDTLLGIADRLGAAILTTPDAKSLVDPRRSCGTFSFGSSALARAVMGAADVVLAVGPLGEFTSRLGEALRGRSFVQLTERVADVGRSAEPTVGLSGCKMHELAARLDAALKSRPLRRRAAWYKEYRARHPKTPLPIARPDVIHPLAAMSAIEAALPRAARICLDVTSGALHAYEHLELARSQRAFSSIEHSACMGEALLASVGIRLASELPTLALVGDWGYCMAPSELHTAVELGLGGYVVLVWANSGGAFIGAGVQQQGIAVPDVAWRWRRPPEFALAANALGAQGVTVTSAEALQAELFRGLRGDRPCLIEARIDPSVPVPAGDRFLTLGVSQGSLHDQE